VSIEFRFLRTAAELADLPAFEARIWGEENPPVSVNMLVACIDEGGVAIGAFDRDRIVGSVFGFRTAEPRVLHSHYLAVDPDRRRAGLGAELKRRQAAWCRRHGVTAMRWTFDPLRLANAHLNLERLGAVGIEYHVDHYGALGGINGSLPSDRLTVRWDLVGPRPVCTEESHVAVLPVTDEQIRTSAPEARTARLALRDAMAPLIAAGWRVWGVDRSARRYTLGRPGTAASC
jgi:predicted GNAT superfamily acetyltransferase